MNQQDALPPTPPEDGGGSKFQFYLTVVMGLVALIAVGFAFWLVVINGGQLHLGSGATPTISDDVFKAVSKGIS